MHTCVWFNNILAILVISGKAAAANLHSAPVAHPDNNNNNHFIINIIFNIHPSHASLDARPLLLSDVRVCLPSAV